MTAEQDDSPEQNSPEQNSGEGLSTFLSEMAEHNQKIAEEGEERQAEEPAEERGCRVSKSKDGSDAKEGQEERTRLKEAS